MSISDTKINDTTMCGCDEYVATVSLSYEWYYKMGYTSSLVWGNNILIRGYETDGTRYATKVKYKPTLYTVSGKSTTVARKNLNDEPLIPLSFEDIKRAKQFVDLQPAKTVFGMNRYEYAYLDETSLELSDHTATMYLDIETECEHGFPNIDEANESVSVITMKCGKRMHTIGLEKYIRTSKTPFVPSDPDHTYTICKDEIELLKVFLKTWAEMDADVITGWNVNLFDLPYLFNRITGLLGEKEAKKMSPWGIVRSRQVFIRGRQQTSYQFYGINILDYYDLYRKFTYTQLPTYKLDYVASVELGEKKLDYKEYDSMHMFYKSDWTKFVEYNVHDVLLVEKLEAKMKLIDLSLMMVKDARANPHDIFSQVRMWDLLIFKYLKPRKYEIPSRVHVPDYDTGQYDGAYVKEPKPGMYDWILSLDVSSMYPNAIRYLNISPETVLENDEIPVPLRILKSKQPKQNIQDIIDNSSGICDFIAKHADADKNVSVSPTGDVFSNDKDGFLAEMMADMFETRKKNKQLAHRHGVLADEYKSQLVERGIDVDGIK